jgi:hypothetical protein
MTAIRCAECGCTPLECKSSKSPSVALIVLGIHVVVGMNYTGQLTKPKNNAQITLGKNAVVLLFCD